MNKFAGAKKSMKVNGKTWTYFDLLETSKFGDILKLPRSLKVLLEMLLRYQNHSSVSDENIKDLASWGHTKTSTKEIPYFPARVLMQDFTGVPAIVDLAAMRDGIKKLGAPASVINPQIPVDLVIDHSVSADFSGNASSLNKNVSLEFERNTERYEFLKWGQTAFSNFRVVPPGMGICHQVNIEFLADVVTARKLKEEDTLFPDTLVGTDSHTTMVNGLSVLGWGVGGIEAEAAMLGQPIAIMIPEVIGFKLIGELPKGATATDLVLTVTQMLRAYGVVGKFVEFFGNGLDNLSLANRATLSNMAPEYGATCGFFPIDDETLNYLRLTARDEDLVQRVEKYAKIQGLWRDDTQLSFTHTLELNMADVVPSLAGPKRPQDRVLLNKAKSSFKHELATTFKSAENLSVPVSNTNYCINNGDVVIAAITSCTNTSNPYVMIGAGLLAQKAVAKGLTVKPWVKTSLAPGSQVVSEYLLKAGIQKDLDTLGFNVVGYGCTTCIGNSGPLADNIQKAIKDKDLVVTSVLSGNRNFEGRISPHVKANYLASPPLVVVYAIAGSMLVDVNKDSLGKGKDGNDVYLADIWPANKEINDVILKVITPAIFKDKYSKVFKGNSAWKNIQISQEETYKWKKSSTYIANPPFFKDLTMEIPKGKDIKEASLLALLGDSVTTDHISPAGVIKADSPAGALLTSKGIQKKDFNSYGSRRGNHNVMMRGTFANIRIKNEMVPDIEGGFTKYIPTGESMPIYNAAMKYIEAGKDLMIIAGKEYGTGSSRDWAAKGTDLLGVKAVIAESFERIHRSNLAGMGVLPLQFKGTDSRKSLDLKGDEKISILNLESLKPRQDIKVKITYLNNDSKIITTSSRLDTADDVSNYQNGGILQATLRRLAR